MTKYFGAHVSISGGYHKAVERLVQMGGNSLQIFSASPRGWNFAAITNEQAKQFMVEKETYKVNSVFFHASYLVNLADKSRIGQNSIQALIAELNVASKIGIRGSIIHLGSYKKNPPSLFDTSTDEHYETLIANCKQVLQSIPNDVYFIIENAGNNKIGKNIQELAAIVSDLNDERVRICLDTCHLFSAGYDLTTIDTYQKFFATFDREIGIDRLAVIHANDSRDPFGSGRDRHENLGEGTLTLDPFRHLVNDKRLTEVPCIIETPGFDGNGPDKKNLDILKSLLEV